MASHLPGLGGSLHQSRAGDLHFALAFGLLLILLGSSATGAIADSADPPDRRSSQGALEGYTPYAELEKQIAALASEHPESVRARSLGTTLDGREVHLIRIAAPSDGDATDPDQRPAVLVVGNVHAPHLVGSEIVMRMARRFAEQIAANGDDRELFEQFTFYLVPRPNPDGSEAFFRPPYRERAGNARPTDDDRDGAIGEDPPDDLNGDGWIMLMRVEDPTGRHLPHPDDPRVLIEAQPARNERGRYRVLVEGRDNDGDGQFNEDASDGVSFNRNFTFKYPYFERLAGPHQVSEVESRAVADFCFDHPNIALVFCFSPEDNLMKPWKPGQAQGRIKTSLLPEDAPYLDHLAQRYRQIHGGKDAPDSPDGKGSFSQWAYFHYGRWSLAARGWWIPKVDRKAGPAAQRREAPAAETDVPSSGGHAPGDAEGSTSPKATDAAKGAPPADAPNSSATAKNGDAGQKSTADARGEEELNALRWFDREGIDGFVPWSAVDHPDFPGQKVEVGGIKPFFTLNPPAGQLDGLAEKHSRFLIEVAKRLPRIKLGDTKIESLGAGLFRVTATVVNEGYLPTASEMGRITGEPHPLQIALDLPEGAAVIQGPARQRLAAIAGNGGKAEAVWLVRLPQPGEAKAALRVWSPSVGQASQTIELK